MLATTLQPTQIATAGVARAVACPKYRDAGNAIAASWTATRTSMLVPSFHDRWPLYSTT